LLSEWLGYVFVLEKSDFGSGCVEAQTSVHTCRFAYFVQPQRGGFLIFYAILELWDIR